MRTYTQLTPRGAMAFGAAFILAGVVPILVGVGAIRVQLPPGIQRWIVAVAGAIFVFAGLSIVNSYALGGGLRPDGALSNPASRAVTVLHYVLRLATVGAMFTVFAWIAVGPGERHFVSRLSFPGARLRGNDSERAGRIAFGICAAFLAIAFLSVCGGAVKQLRGARARGAAS